MAKLLNILLITLGVFFLAFMWLFYYLKVVWIAVTISAVFACLLATVLFVIFPLKTKKNIKKAIVKIQKRLEIELNLSDNSQLFIDIYKNKGYAVERELSYFTVKKIVDTTLPNTANNLLSNKIDTILTPTLTPINNNKKTLVDARFNFTNYTKNDLANAIKCAKKNNCDSVTILTNHYNCDVKSIIDYANVNINLYDINDVYNLLSASNTLPVMVEKTKTKSKFYYYAFNKSRFNYYFWSSMSLLFLSIFSFYPIYTLVFATILLFCALFSRFNKRYNLDEKTTIIQ